jgi:hypothetical protein
MRHISERAAMRVLKRTTATEPRNKISNHRAVAIAAGGPGGGCQMIAASAQVWSKVLPESSHRLARSQLPWLIDAVCLPIHYHHPIPHGVLR